MFDGSDWHHNLVRSALVTMTNVSGKGDNRLNSDLYAFEFLIPLYIWAPYDGYVDTIEFAKLIRTTTINYFIIL